MPSWSSEPPPARQSFWGSVAPAFSRDQQLNPRLRAEPAHASLTIFKVAEQSFTHQLRAFPIDQDPQTRQNLYTLGINRFRGGNPLLAFAQLSPFLATPPWRSLLTPIACRLFPSGTVW
jgi:hypothetical protein